MNELSFLIYLIDVFNSINSFTGVMSFIAIISFIIVSFLTTVSLYCYQAQDTDENLAAYNAFQRGLKYIIVVCFIVVPLNILVPNQNTMYMIAASEVGEEVIMSPEIDKVRTIINEKLDEILEEPDDED